MKRTNLVLDADLLERTVRATGEKTYSGAVTRAMREFVRLYEFKKIFELEGSGIVVGDLAMERDRNRPTK